MGGIGLVPRGSLHENRDSEDEERAFLVSSGGE